MSYSEPNKICRISFDNGWVRADGLPVDMNHLYIQPDRDNPIEGEAWLYDGPFPDSIVTPPPAEDA